MPKPMTELPDSQVTPLPKLEKRTRRKFTAEYKLRILAEADACQHGELGPLLRREKLYSNQLHDWRRELAKNGAEGLAKSVPGPTSSTTPEQRQIARLEKELAKVNRKLQMAEDCVALQKKVFQIIDQSNNDSDV